jgi:PAS domain S-box-containing protein
VSFNASVFRDPSGDVRGIFASARDITDQARLQTQLAEERAYNRGLIEASLDGLITVDPMLAITDVNETMCCMSGFARTDLIGSQFPQYFTDPKRAAEGVRLTLARGAVTNSAPTLRTHDGRESLVSFNAAIFRDQEDAYGYFVILRDTVRQHGIPIALYGDRHGIVTAEAHQRPLTIDEQLQGRSHPLTQLGRALAELHITWIPASTPQAKGRIERLWGTFQDRLVSELRRARTRTLQEANDVLARFLPRYNARFAQAPADPRSAYRPLAPDQDLEAICCFAYERTVANDNTVQLGEHLLQLLPGPHRRSYAKARVVVREHLDGTLSVSHQGDRLVIQRLPRSARPQSTGRLLRARHYDRLQPATRPAPRKTQERFRARREASRYPLPKAKRRQPTGQGTGSWTPPPDHPWRHLAKQAARRKRLKEAGVTFSLNA